MNLAQLPPDPPARKGGKPISRYCIPLAEGPFSLPGYAYVLLVDAQGEALVTDPLPNPRWVLERLVKVGKE